MSHLVNGFPASSMRWFAPWSGVWTAELELDAAELAPSGRVLVVGSQGFTLNGTVDPKHSGSFGEKRFARVIGGGAGWAKPVRAQHYHSDVGVPFATIVATTAAEVGEVAVVVDPSIAGLDYARSGHPQDTAAQIFSGAGVDWWVGLDGVTRVGPRLPLPPPPSLQLTEWNPSQGTVGFTSDVLVEPGTVVVDLRIGGPRVVREVEATVSEGSVSGTLRLAEGAPEAGTLAELAEELAALARAATRARYARQYEYVVLVMAGDRVELKAITKGAPDLLPASVWAGISGYRASLTPGSRVLVGFVDADPRRPYVAAYEAPERDGWRPLRLEFDAVGDILIGAQAALVVFGAQGSARPVVRLTEALTAWIAAVTAVVNSVSPGAAVPPTDLASLKVVAS